MSKANDREAALAKDFFEKARQLVPGTKLRFVSRTRELGESALRVGVALPEGLSIVGNEAYSLHDLSEKLSEAEKYRIGVETTAVAEGEILEIAGFSKDDWSEEKLVSISGKQKQTNWRGKVPVVALCAVVLSCFGFMKIGENNTWIKTSEGPGNKASLPPPPPSVSSVEMLEYRFKSIDEELAELEKDFVQEGKSESARKISMLRLDLKKVESLKQ